MDEEKADMACEVFEHQGARKAFNCLEPFLTIAETRFGYLELQAGRAD